MRYKATKMDEIYQAFHLQPLKIEELDTFYKDTSKARSRVNPRSRIARLLRRELRHTEHILLVGYKGCGKSTELNKLEAELQDKFLVINFSVMEELDPVHLHYIELFIVMMERLFTKAKEEELAINKDLLKRIINWTKTREITEIKEKYLGVELEAGASATFGIPYLQKFFAKFKATAKTSGSLKEALKRNVEPKLSDLIEHCNALILEIRLELIRAKEMDDLLVIIEDLDKIPLERAEQLFFNYINQLTQLRTNVIFTFPIALYYSLKFNEIKQYFSKTEELYMIKVQNRDGSPAEKGIKAMEAVVAARMDLTLFEEAAILEEMIQKSGGCLRDLFLLIREAAESALDVEGTHITREDYAQAYSDLKSDYENTIADKMVNGKVIYTAQQYYDALAALAKSTDKKILNSAVFLQLRQNLTVLGYNGENWCDVHPIVKDILKERNLI